MREQIHIDLPERIGKIMQEVKIKKIIVHKDHRDIIIHIRKDDEYLEKNERNNTEIEIIIDEEQ